MTCTNSFGKAYWVICRKTYTKWTTLHWMLSRVQLAAQTLLTAQLIDVFCQNPLAFRLLQNSGYLSRIEHILTKSIPSLWSMAHLSMCIALQLLEIFPVGEGPQLCWMRTPKWATPSSSGRGNR